MQNTYRNAPQLETLRIRNELKTFRTGDSSKGSTPPPCLIILIILFLALGAFFAQKGSNKAQESIRAKDTLKIETIEDFAKWALIEKTGKRKIFYLCNVVPAQAIIINKFSKHDISKYKWILDNFGIRHILNKPAHGIKTVDLNKVYSIINTFNKIVEIDAKKDVVMLKVYKDFIDYRITFFAEIRPKNNEITIITMYKNRNKE